MAAPPEADGLAHLRFVNGCRALLPLDVANLHEAEHRGTQEHEQADGRKGQIGEELGACRRGSDLGGDSGRLGAGEDLQRQERRRSPQAGRKPLQGLGARLPPGGVQSLSMRWRRIS